MGELVHASELFGKVASGSGITVVNDRENFGRLRVVSPAWAVKMRSGFLHLVRRAIVENWKGNDQELTMRIVVGAAKLAGFNPRTHDTLFDMTSTANVNQFMRRLLNELDKQWPFIWTISQSACHE